MSTFIELYGELEGEDQAKAERRWTAILNATKIVIAKAQRPTVETLLAELPEVMFPGFHASPPGQDEIDAAMALIEQQAAEHVATLEATAPAEPAEMSNSNPLSEEMSQAEPALLHEVTVSAPTLAPDQAVENLRQANVRFAHARANVLTMTNRRNLARTRLSEAVTAWQVGSPKISRDQLMRDYIRSEQEQKLAIAEGRMSPRQGPRIGPSVIDRVAAAQRGGPAAWGNFRRNGSLVRGGLNFDPRKGPVAKLPSQR